jgi:sugar lactone lactonase YvrE
MRRKTTAICLLLGVLACAACGAPRAVTLTTTTALPLTPLVLPTAIPPPPTPTALPTATPLPPTPVALPTATALPSTPVVLATATALPPTPTPEPAPSPETITLAGGTAGYADGPLAEARFDSPLDVAVDGQGNIYVLDRGNHRVRRITAEGAVSTLAGSGEFGYADGEALAAQFGALKSIAVDGFGNIYVSDTARPGYVIRIRRITVSGQVTSLAGGSYGYADGLGREARFHEEFGGLAADDSGNIYVADTGNQCIRIVAPDGAVTTLAGKPGGVGGFGDGPVAEALFKQPQGVAVDERGTVYVADTLNHRIRCISPEGQVTTLAGMGDEGFVDGPADQAQFKFPTDVTVAADGTVYVADLANNRIRFITPTGEVGTLAGTGEWGHTDGPNEEATFGTPTSLALDGRGHLYVVEPRCHCVRQITLP